jgi:hypothetical protein
METLAPEQEEEVLDMGALAPDEPVMEREALAPEQEEEEQEEETVLDMEGLAPGERVVELDALGPLVVDEPVLDLEDLAPDASTAEPDWWGSGDEAVLDFSDLGSEERMVELDSLGPPEVDEAPAAVELEAPLEPEAPVTMEPRAPTAEEPSEAVEEPEEPPEPSSGDGPLVTRTMAELYARQGLRSLALEVYRQILAGSPRDEGVRERVASLEAELGTGGTASAEAEPEAPPFLDAVDEGDLSDHAWDAAAQAAGHDVDTPFAWTTGVAEDAPPARPPISAYFRRLLAWEPRGGADSAEGTEEGISAPEGDDFTNWMNQDEV